MQMSTYVYYTHGYLSQYYIMQNQATHTLANIDMFATCLVLSKPTKHLTDTLYNCLQGKGHLEYSRHCSLRHPFARNHHRYQEKGQTKGPSILNLFYGMTVVAGLLSLQPRAQRKTI